ncbi:hypothetical protein HRG_002683 [Hirsutella rhossiliensis]|uniref:Uncharacterized protein n=1 Tax=Hirsutella rhossiliensis TaxID=111463 RepID=A0A9P8N7P9_9HYPO|nr:uncharacterized protein HRG_02683 [Hirsutella rhossiliensis]KAH0967274.1 hypothetical protein HRG_02683 [Hirsutella rhossiliensis]
MGLAIAPPDQAGLLAPLLPALPAAAASAQPAVKLLPLLSPILRQRVQLLSESSSEPWLRLLCYDAAKAVKLADIVRGPSLEPHPVSGEVEVDWGYDAHTRYRRLDRETLQALVALPELGIAFQLVYCVGDHEGGGDGWRIGEVTVADKPSPFSRFGGASTIVEAERHFQDGQGNGGSNSQTKATLTSQQHDNGPATAQDDDDDDYWGRYDATPARTPAVTRSPGPCAVPSSRSTDPYRPASTEDDYFAQYDQVQPAMDNHDPDEEAQNAHLVPPLGLGSAQSSGLPGQGPDTTATSKPMSADIIHPRPESSASSNGSYNVARLEETAGKQEQNEFGVKQHVSRSIRSLYMLARTSGIAREEFARLVTTELAVLGIMEEDD